MGETRQEDQESFTPIYYELEVSPKLLLLPGVYLGPSFRVLETEIVRIEAGGALASGAIPGSRGGSSVELGMSLLWDTRDRTLYPRAGGLLRARLASARRAWGSDFDYDVLRLDARRYFSLPWPGHIAALQALAELRAGIPPFYGTGRLGGAEMLRGYYEGRYRERQYLAAQSEYRAPLVWRLGAVLFVAAGSVAPTLDGLAVVPLKVAAGAGLRLAPLADVPVNVRLDVAFGDDVNFYFGIGEAF
jgi:outer membrane protein assembly factor BamA